MRSSPPTPRALAAALAAGVLALPLSASAQTDVACWYRDVEQLDRTIDPVQGGDNDFFTSSDVSPNLIWMLDNSGSMLAQPCAGGSGCSEYAKCGGGFNGWSNTYFTARGYKGYTTDLAAYDAYDPDYCTTVGDPRAFSGKQGCYKPGLVYRGNGGSGGGGCNWPGDGQAWKIDVATEAQATITNWCITNYLAYPPNPGTNPTACANDSQCATGYKCLDRTGDGTETKRCYLQPLDCTTAGYTCPAGYTCNSTTKACENGTVVITPPSPFDTNTSCSSDTQCRSRTASTSASTYLCRRSDGSTSGTRYCYLGTHWAGAVSADWANCTTSGYVCPPTFTCNSTSKKCEKTVAKTAPHYSTTTTCTADANCPTGYRCLNAAGGRISGTLTCRLPVWDCTTTGYTCPSNTTYSCDTSTKVCQDPDFTKCVANLQTYGYAPGGSTEDPVFTGDLLNFSPPKFVSGRKILKDVVPKVVKTRQALFRYNSSNNYGQVVQHLGPTCDKFVSGGATIVPDDSLFTAQATAIVTSLGSFAWSASTPLAETLVSACQYITSDPTRWKTQVKFTTKSNTTYTGVGSNSGDFDPNLASRSGNNDSICFTCQKNFVVLVTDGLPTADDKVPSRLRTYMNDGNTDYLDDVAGFCYDTDLRPDLSGKQNTVVHTVAFGIDAPILDSAAVLGGGVSLSAEDDVSLKNALAQIVEDVNKRATSFSVASVTTVQTRGSTYAFVPRFKPSTEELWEGHLYRFKLFNEFAAGCTTDDTVAPMDSGKLSRNLNADGDCGDVYLLDKNNAVVAENSDGDYKLADTSITYDDTTGWPVKTPEVLATPVWDAADRLLTRDLVNNPRVIYTVVDSNNDGVLSANEQIAFTVANVDTLLPYLALGGASGDVCDAMRAKLSLGTITERDCAIYLIRYIRGEDIFDEDKDTKKNDPRPRILADIFHSSPILVTAPPPSYLCDLGLSTQCVASLYSDTLTPEGRTQYNAWATAQTERKQIVVVGSNDGLIHAFQAGTWQDGNDVDTPDIVETRYLNLGTGDELWAFLPPDLLPKIRRLITRDGRHEILVDGTAMIRDIWVDSTTNVGKKDSTEFRTIAVVGERQGGRGWTTLDITNPDSPSFRWSWPSPGHKAVVDAGETWADFAPGAPPIGPVALAKSDGPLIRSGTKFEERWVAFLGGGYDPSLVRGRAIHVLDVWTGTPVWRFARADSTGASDLRNNIGPVASAISLLDLGPDGVTKGRQDGLFDTAVVGDAFGQVWTLRFYDPGSDSAGNDGLMDNWFAARAFVQNKTSPLVQRNAFFQMAEASIAPDTGSVRVYLGSGDRPNIRQKDGGECSLINLAACVRKGCSVEITDADVTIGTFGIDAGWKVINTGTTRNPDKETLTVAGGSLSCSSPTKGTYSAKLVCGNGAGPLTSTLSWSLDCDWDASNDGALCLTNAKPDPFFSAIQYTSSTTNARFYSIRLFDSVRAPFTNSTQASAYDTAALTDSNLGDADGSSAGTSDDDGYYVAYGYQDERTSSAASILGGCVYWNTLKPDATSGTCGAKIADEGRLYHAHYGTGAKTCGSITSTNPLGLVRSTVRTAIVPPPPPTPVVSFNRTTGEVRYSMVTVEPASPPAQVNVGAGDLAGTIYWLEVPREVHDCRHGTGNCR